MLGIWTLGTWTPGRLDVGLWMLGPKKLKLPFTVKGAVTDLSNTRVLLLVNKIYTTDNKYLLGIYAIVNQVTLRPKEMIHMFAT